MMTIENIKLEFLRPGPAHNQLLSPLTLYIALCGREGPATVNFPFEQRQLLTRMERLRYITPSGAIPQQQREAEVQEIGEIIGEVLGKVPALDAPNLRSDSPDGAAIRCQATIVRLDPSAD